jgi:biofilm PGA synthesis N-glycosyltransferase PgaC
MLALKLLFFISLFIIFYSYIGYGIVIWILVKIKNAVSGKKNLPANDFRPPVTLIIAAYNEADFIEQKIANSLQLNYPEDKLQLLFITDGSNDATPAIIQQYPRITLLHSDERRGKVAAMHRAMAFVNTPYVVFSDANTLLNSDSIINIVRHYQNPKVGGVAGEKKVIATTQEGAAGAGEGLYWKYESFLKQMDSDFYTVVGAAGELFSVKTDLYENPGATTLLDDFVISLRVCQKGYTVKYAADAFASETPSASIEDEQKRKVRIGAGGFQSMLMLLPLLNFFKYPRLSFQYVSHRVLRWAICPFLLPLILVLNIVLVVYEQGFIYQVILVLQILFYAAAMGGWVLHKRNIKSKLLYVPYYFLFINVCLYLGFVRFIKGRQTVLWEKAARAK